MTTTSVSFKSLFSTFHDTSLTTLALTLERIMSSKCALKTVQFYIYIYNFLSFPLFSLPFPSSSPPSFPYIFNPGGSTVLEQKLYFLSATIDHNLTSSSCCCFLSTRCYTGTQSFSRASCVCLLC